MNTFDIWLEDSQGRQFRRSNHYSWFYNSALFVRYHAMQMGLKAQGIKAYLRLQTFNH
jgi:hypothetical protein